LTLKYRLAYISGLIRGRVCGASQAEQYFKGKGIGYNTYIAPQIGRCTSRIPQLQRRCSCHRQSGRAA